METRHGSHAVEHTGHPGEFGGAISGFLVKGTIAVSMADFYDTVAPQ